MKDISSLEVAELTDKCQLSLYKANRIDPMAFCARNIRPSGKGFYIPDNMLGPKLVLSHGLGLGPDLTWPRPLPGTTTKISHYR